MAMTTATNKGATTAAISSGVGTTISVTKGTMDEIDRHG